MFACVFHVDEFVKQRSAQSNERQKFDRCVTALATGHLLIRFFTFTLRAALKFAAFSNLCTPPIALVGTARSQCKHRRITDSAVHSYIHNKQI
jgi:hypothetical protein